MFNFIILLSCFLFFLNFINSCKKNKSIDNQPEMIIITDKNYYNTLDTIKIEFIVKNYKNVDVKVIITDLNLKPIIIGNLIKDIKPNTKYYTLLYISERWLPSDKYYLCFLVYDKTYTYKFFKEITIFTMQPKILKYLIITENNYNIYEVDHILKTQTFIKSETNVLDVLFFPLNKTFGILKKNGSLNVYDLNFNLKNQVHNLNKIGVEYSGNIQYKYPLFYVINANGMIYGLNTDFQIKEIIPVIEIPYFIKWCDTLFMCFSKKHNENLFFVINLKNKKIITLNEKPIDIININNFQFILITKNFNNEFNILQYNEKYGTINKLCENKFYTYNGSLKINSDIFISLDNTLFTYNKLTQKLEKIQNIALTKPKKYNYWDYIFFVNQDSFFVTKSNFQDISFVVLPEKIFIFDIIYE